MGRQKNSLHASVYLLSEERGTDWKRQESKQEKVLDEEDRLWK